MFTNAYGEVVWGVESIEVFIESIKLNKGEGFCSIKNEMNREYNYFILDMNVKKIYRDAKGIMRRLIIWAA